MRVVRTPAGDMVPDPTGRAAGRGAYLDRSIECIDKAITKGALSRALKSPLPTDLREALVASLTNMNTIEGGTRGKE
jgi:predicted RNA-binding protein YlxR (DUF448 family)